MLLLDDSAAHTLPPKEVIFNDARYTLPRFLYECYDSVYAAAVEHFVAKSFESNPLPLRFAGADVLPPDFLTSDAIATPVGNALEAMFSAFDQPDQDSIPWPSPPRLKSILDYEANRDFFPIGYASPVRSDFRIALTEPAKQDNFFSINQGRQRDHTLLTVHGFVELMSYTTGKQSIAYQPRFVITYVETGFSAQQIRLQLLAFITAYAVQCVSTWHAPWKEAEGVTVPLDGPMVYAVDLPHGVSTTWHWDAFLAAAQSNLKAKEAIMEAAENLTNIRINPINLHGQLEPILMGHLQQDRHLSGELVAYHQPLPNSITQPTSDAEVVPPTVGDSIGLFLSPSQPTFFSRSKPELVRLCEQLDALKAAGQDIIITGYATRMTLNASFLEKLIQGLHARGTQIHLHTL